MQIIKTAPNSYGLCITCDVWVCDVGAAPGLAGENYITCEKGETHYWRDGEEIDLDEFKSFWARGRVMGDLESGVSP